MGRDREMERERELRERELRDQEMREREIRERSLQQHQAEMRMRELEARDRERMYREQQEQQRPVQSHAGSTPLHQPVANRVQNSIHGPNGLLSNGGAGPQPNGPTQTNSTSIFNTAPPASEPRPSYLPPGQSNSQPPAPAFLGGGPSPMPAQAQLPHGQQPILNVSLICSTASVC